jgi:hypothetical protein
VFSDLCLATKRYRVFLSFVDAARKGIASKHPGWARTLSPSRSSLKYRDRGPRQVIIDVVVAAEEATTVTVSVASSKAASGTVFEVDVKQGDTSLLTGKVSL